MVMCCHCTSWVTVEWTRKGEVFTCEHCGGKFTVYVKYCTASA